ncbi:heavy metal translocatin [Saccharata proteae CBS 121410]|uniref:Heavy metal translocatin n=1 Tax=Saccharata proteae CBS 121410 TaxID=1314787 RepID=A0A9P4HSI6_9PEZI|nr:heavy metal translocatin [Saccharata proteae CBS 121410]
MQPASPGSGQASPVQPPTVDTTFFISNLHCSSCVQSIDDALRALAPRPSHLHYSILSHSVTVTHSPSLTTDLLSKSLEDAGFEIHSVFRISDNETVTELANPSQGSEWENSLEQAVRQWREKWNTSSKAPEPDMQKRQRHIEQCPECAAELNGDDIEKKRLSPGDALELDSIYMFDAKAPRTLTATVAITGMTCSACVGCITRQVEELPFVRFIAVSLLTHSAFVEFEGRENAEAIVSTIEDAGFDATLENLEDAGHQEQGKAQSDTWRATYAIGGMTCSACVAAITDVLRQHDWIKTTDINLLSNSGTIVFDGKDNLDTVRETIEDAGFDATLDNVENVGSQQETNLQRLIGIRVDGMFCRHCPANIVAAIARDFEGAVEIYKPPTLDDPVIQVKYIPRPPSVTIRTIMAAIEDVSSEMETSIYHPPTIEERAREMHARERKRVLIRLVLSIVVAIPTFIIGIVFMSLVSSDNPVRVFFMHSLTGGVSRAQWALFILATPIYFLAADKFHRRAMKEVKALWRRGSKTPILQRFYRFGSMNMLMSLGTTIAYVASIAQLIISACGVEKVAESDYYFDSVVFLTMFILIGRFLEAYSKGKTGDAVTALSNLRPDEAILVDSAQNQDHKISVDLLEIGDVVRVQHGSSPPFDGTVVEGTAKFDESSLTGESRPVDKNIDDVVFAGTVNKGGPVLVRITSVSGTSMLDQIIKVVREGQTRRAPVERVADMITGHFVPVVTLVAIVTWLVWLGLGLSGVLPSHYRDNDSGSWELWSLRFAIAVFVVACPCGIGLASPTALFVGGGLAARHGILVKGGGEAFQEASCLDCIVFDKTGTLTQGGDPAVTDHEITVEWGSENVLAIARKLEEASSHPIASAISSFCAPRANTPIETVEIEEIPGKGLKGRFRIEEPYSEDIEAIIGNESLMEDLSVPIEPETLDLLDSWKRSGKSVALMATSILSTRSTLPTTPGWTLSALFAISDPLRPSAAPTVAALRNRGIDVWMLSGDNPTTAVAVGALVGIPSTNIIAGVLPDQKAEKILYLQRCLAKKPGKHATIAMVGDGINDSPALTMADVGVAIGSGSDVAISSADFILVTSRLESLLTLVDLSRTVFRRVWFNFGWALVYNLCAMPIAAGALYPVTVGGTHVRLDPVWASLAMAMSSVSVVCSSLALRSGLPGLGFRDRVGLVGREYE